MEMKRILRTMGAAGRAPWVLTPWALAPCLFGCASPQTATLAAPPAESSRQGTANGAQANVREEAVGRTMAAANNAFALQLLAELAPENADKNVFFSPASVSLALSMVYNGVGGATRDAVAKALQFGDMGQEQVNQGNAALQRSLANPDPKIQINIANALWADEGVRFRADFVERAREFYGAEASTLDLQGPGALETLNGWVSKKTREKIPTLFGSDDLSNATAVLANAIYFKGIWTKQFDKAATREGDFTLPGGGKKRLPMMSQTGVHKHLRGNGFEAVALSYGEGQVSMYVFVPNAASDLKTFLGSLNASRWNEWMSQFRQSEIEVVLPRFKVTYEADLNRSLTELGMGIAFGNGADFAPMGLPGHSLSLVKHKAVIEVNEEGTEAAAATGGVTTISLKPRIEVNRPFFCAIRDDKNGALLFVGAVTDPA